MSPWRDSGQHSAAGGRLAVAWGPLRPDLGTAVAARAPSTAAPETTRPGVVRLAEPRRRPTAATEPAIRRLGREPSTTR